MCGQQATRRVAIPRLPSRQRAERYGQIWGPISRRADALRRLPVELCYRQERIQFAGLALIDRHARGRVALQMLDRLVSLAQRKLDIGDGDIVLEVEPLSASAPGWRATHRAHRGAYC